MSNFHSNYNDIHKQIAIADFTDEQIQELMTALQIKRSAKSKLTKEEKVFYQCCRERRSYAQNQDLDTVVCPICGSVKVIKNGTRTGRQRYFCKNCRKTFGDTNGTVAFRSKMSIGKWIEFIKLTLQGESCRMTTLELVLNMLAEATTTEISKQRAPESFAENIKVAREGGEAAGEARKAVEARTGVPVITSQNAAQLNQVVTDLIEGTSVNFRDGETKKE